MTDLAMNVVPMMGPIIDGIYRAVLNVVGGVILLTGLYYMARATYRVVLRR